MKKIKKHIAKSLLLKSTHCCYCGTKFNNVSKLYKKTIDHFYPINPENKNLNLIPENIDHNHISNLRICCMKCNIIKSNFIFNNDEEVKVFIKNSEIKKNTPKPPKILAKKSQNIVKGKANVFPRAGRGFGRF